MTGSNWRIQTGVAALATRRPLLCPLSEFLLEHRNLSHEKHFYQFNDRQNCTTEMFNFQLQGSFAFHQKTCPMLHFQSNWLPQILQSWIQTLDQTQWWVGDFQNCPARITNTAGGDPTNRRKSCRHSALNTHLESWKLIAFYNFKPLPSEGQYRVTHWESKAKPNQYQNQDFSLGICILWV